MLFLILATALSAHASNLCVKALTEGALGFASVYEVSGPQFEKSVVRFPGNGSNPKFEVFASGFLRSRLDQKIVNVRMIRQGEAQAVISAINQTAGRHQRSVTTNASIAPFVEGVKGSRFLEDLNVDLTELKRLLIDERNGEGPIPSNDTYSALLSKIPVSILNQIAELWAGYFIIGIPDFHPDNWIVSIVSHNIIGIDLAYHIPHFDQTRPFQSFFVPFILEKYQAFYTTPSMTRFLLSRLSNGFIAKLRRVNRAAILQTAQNFNFPITEQEVSDILFRVKILLDSKE